MSGIRRAINSHPCCCSSSTWVFRCL